GRVLLRAAPQGLTRLVAASLTGENGADAAAFPHGRARPGCMLPSLSHLMPALPRRTTGRGLLRLLLAWALLACAPALADVIPVRSADLRVEDGDVLLSAQFDVELTPALDQALHKGIPLYFTVEFELARPRWYWVDEKVAQW